MKVGATVNIWFGIDAELGLFGTVTVVAPPGNVPNPAVITVTVKFWLGGKPPETSKKHAADRSICWLCDACTVLPGAIINVRVSGGACPPLPGLVFPVTVIS
jgi:hypothetical protein